MTHTERGHYQFPCNLQHRRSRYEFNEFCQVCVLLVSQQHYCLLYCCSEGLLDGFELVVALEDQTGDDVHGREYLHTHEVLFELQRSEGDQVASYADHVETAPHRIEELGPWVVDSLIDEFYEFFPGVFLVTGREGA